MKLQQIICDKLIIGLLSAMFFLALPLVCAAQGKIAFYSTRDGNPEIYVMNPDGSNQTRLTSSPATDANPAFSPDGSKITFTSDRDGDLNFEIYVMNADGTNQINLTNNSAIDDGPSFSPDGSKIVFMSTRDAGNVEVYMMNADGTNQVNLSKSPADDWGASFSPDGSRIAFTSRRDGNSEIYVMNADGTNQARLTDNPADDNQSSFSPDGSKIAFVSRRDGNAEIYVMNADGTNQTRLTNNPADEHGPSFSPDGSKIIFSSTRDGNPEIYVMNIDGTNQINLSNNPAHDFHPSWGGGQVVEQYQFSWFSFSDLLTPNNQINTVQAGSNVQVNFTLNGFQGPNIYSAPPASQRIDCLTGTPIGAVQAINRVLPDPSYNAQFGFYTTVWLTQAQWAGTCRRLILKLDDGSTHTLDFRFK